MKTTHSLPPLTAALLAEQPDALRDVLVRLAERGLAACREFLANRLVRLANFEQCAATDYSDSSRTAAVDRHSKRLRKAKEYANTLAGSANSLAQLAATQGVRDPIFDEMETTVNTITKLAHRMNGTWQSERARILQREELERFRFTLAVAVVRQTVKGTGPGEADALEEAAA